MYGVVPHSLQGRTFGTMGRRLGLHMNTRLKVGGPSASTRAPPPRARVALFFVLVAVRTDGMHCVVALSPDGASDGEEAPEPEAESWLFPMPTGLQGNGGNIEEAGGGPKSWAHHAELAKSGARPKSDGDSPLTGGGVAAVTQQSTPRPAIGQRVRVRFHIIRSARI